LRGRQHRYAERQTGVVGQPRYTEQSAAASGMSLMAQVGMMTSRTAFDVMKVDAVHMGMTRTFMLRRSVYFVKFG
jgi:hypothetical protein